MTNTNALAEYKTMDGEQLSITMQDARERFCSQATDKELMEFAALAKNTGANPYKREIYLIKYGSQPASVILSYHMFNRIAQSHKDYNGIESGVIVLDKTGNIREQHGSAYFPQAGQKLVGGWAKVHRKGIEHPFTATVNMSEYSTGKANWQKMPATMIEKVAKSQAWRLAYPAEFSGVYTSEEMGQAQSQSEPIEVAHTETQKEPKKPELDMYQKQIMTDICRDIAEITGEDLTECKKRVIAEYGNPLDSLERWDEYEARLKGVLDQLKASTAPVEDASYEEPELADADYVF